MMIRPYGTWISVDDELPEEQDEYLIAWIPTDKNYIKNCKFCYVAICEWDKEYGWLTDSLDQAKYYDIEVKAWMPLPAMYQYREERSKDENSD